MGRGHDEHRGVTLEAPGDLPADGGMGIHQVAVVLEHGADGFETGLGVGPTGGEVAAQKVERPGVHAEHAFLGQVLHPGAHLRTVAVCLEEEALQVGRDEDVHGRRCGLHQTPRRDVVDAGGEEVGEDVVGVRRAHQAAGR